MRPLAEQIAAARQAYPEGTLASVVTARTGGPTRVVLSVPELGEKQHRLRRPVHRPGQGRPDHLVGLDP
ncbi:hypothetical protein ACFQ0M_49455, partial [Kitasatospora aburaviensis]